METDLLDYRLANFTDWRETILEGNWEHAPGIQRFVVYRLGFEEHQGPELPPVLVKAMQHILYGDVVLGEAIQLFRQAQAIIRIFVFDKPYNELGLSNHYQRGPNAKVEVEDLGGAGRDVSIVVEYLLYQLILAPVMIQVLVRNVERWFAIDIDTFYSFLCDKLVEIIVPGCLVRHVRGKRSEGSEEGRPDLEVFSHHPGDRAPKLRESGGGVQPALLRHCFYGRLKAYC